MTNSLFENYAELYDAFYVTKDYTAECVNILGIASCMNSSMSRAIEIGSGSGKFTKELLKEFDHVDAFEISPRMAKLCSSNLAGYKNVNIHLGDIAQTFRQGLTPDSFDLVIANFHVFTYFNEEETRLFVEVCQTFLNSGGIVCFDFWDLKAVINNPPISIERVAMIGDSIITRKTLPIVKNNFKEIEIIFDFYESSKFLFRETHYMFPKSLAEVMSLFEKKFEFCGSYDVASGLQYNEQSYGNLVFFRKIA